MPWSQRKLWLHFKRKGEIHGEKGGLAQPERSRIARQENSKVVFEMKDLYETSPQAAFSVLKWELKKEPEKFTDIMGDKWGYQIVPITVEKIHSHYPLTERTDEHVEELREAVKLYDSDTQKISYLAADRLSVIGHLSCYKGEFVRIFVFDEKEELEYDRITREIRSMIQS